jgi:tRNA pseudouridine13 synthase
MLQHLSAHPGDYLGALRRLPLRLLRLLIQAYQAYLFNLELSYLLAELGDFRNIAPTTDTLPLPGYLTRGIELEGSLGRLMAEEGVSPRDFYVGPLWELSAPGDRRKIRALPGDLRLAAPRKTSVEVSFLLPRGAYATMLLREIMKPENPVAAGF